MRGSILADLPLTSVQSPGDWLVLAGAAVAVIGFLLPWPGRGDVILGTQGGSGYVDRWGLASFANLVVFVLVVVTLGLAILSSRIAPWVRSGVLPLVVGGLCAGLGWIYFTRPFGSDIGVYALIVGAALMLAGGIWSVRHASNPPSV